MQSNPKQRSRASERTRALGMKTAGPSASYWLESRQLPCVPYWTKALIRALLTDDLTGLTALCDDLKGG
jgi:hypothetical protein